MTTSLKCATLQITPSVLDRYEAKYTIPDSMVDDISSFIAPYCSQDEYSAREDTGFYTVNSLYFDTPQFLFLRNRMMRVESRFSMRIRAYGDIPAAPYFMEIKRKRGDIIRKIRARVYEDDLELFLENDSEVVAESASADEINAGLFRRTALAYDAHPVVLTQYKRKAFAGDLEEYARVTFDKQLKYVPRSYCRVSPDGDMLLPTDYEDCFDACCSVVLELKCYTAYVPMWMIDLVKTFDLKRRGFSKYSNAMKQVIGTYPDIFKDLRHPAMLDDFDE